MSEWIPVSERLPDNGAQFLGYDDCATIDHFQRNGDSYFNLNSMNRPRVADTPHGKFPAHLTHWMPLPEPPQ